jgi:hypothetical protein
MFTQLSRTIILPALLAGIFAIHALAQDHPQEVLDLISAHEALAMKIRILQDRVSVPKSSETGFRPDSAPARAKVATAAETDAAGAEKRVPETLRHRDRAAADPDDDGRIKVRLSALAQDATAERERINRPAFGAGTRRVERENGDIRFGDGQRGTRPTESSNRPGRMAANPATVDARALAEARQKLARLEQELRSLERQLEER